MVFSGLAGLQAAKVRAMTKDQAISYFGSVTKLAEAIDVTVGAISQWLVYPPGGRQLQIQAITRGKLKAEPDCMKSTRGAAAPEQADKAGA
jgi:hypothetical protein